MNTFLQRLRKLEVPEWFEEEDLGRLVPSIWAYLPLYTFMFVLGMVFYVHRLKPIEHEILVETPQTARLNLDLSKDFILKWGSVRDGFPAQVGELEYLTSAEARLTPSAFEVEFGVVKAFSGGRAELQPEAFEDTAKLVQAIYPHLTDERIEVLGFTDDTPVQRNADVYPTNIELSALRASIFVRKFIEAGFPAERIQPVAFGATFPKFPNRDETGDPLIGNQAKNRRIVVRVMPIPTP